MKNGISSVFNFLFGPRIEKKKVLAVYEENVEDLLNKVSGIAELDRGDLACHFCGKRITKENLQCVFKKDDKLAFCCEEMECYLNVVEMVKAESEE